MRKRFALGVAALALSATMISNAQEVTYYPDCAQGLLAGKNCSNWFITLQGGANMLFGPDDVRAAINNRICGQGAIYAGKWVTPTFGFRFGANFKMAKGAALYGDIFQKWNNGNYVYKDKEVQPGIVNEKWMGVGPEFDVLISLTNWWCGYREDRVYNAVLHGGAGAYWRWHYSDPQDNATVSPVYESYDPDNAIFYPDAKWTAAHNTVLFLTAGIQQNFRIAKCADFFIDVQYQLIDPLTRSTSALDLNLGFNFYLGKQGWDCPINASCPTWKYTDAEGDHLVSLLSAANAEIESLRKQLNDCLNRPVEKVAKAANCDQLVTIYYPINQYNLSAREKKVLSSVADVMIAHPEETYLLTGWADNWTGTESINEALRWNRVNTVKKYLVSCGVPESQLEATIDNANLVGSSDYNNFNAESVDAGSAPLDRAVTIKLK